MYRKHRVWGLCILTLLLLLLTSCTMRSPIDQPPVNDTEATDIIITLRPQDSEPSDTETDTEAITESVAPVSLRLVNPDSEIGILSGEGSYTPGQTVTVRAAVCLLGYRFDGWYLGTGQDEKCLSLEESFSFTCPNSSIELTAKWCPRTDLSAFTFTSTQTTCTITGVLNRNTTALVIPSYVTELAPAAFRDCASLSAVTILANIPRIPASLFEGCSSLTELSYAYPFEAIEQSAFLGCDALYCSTYGNTRYLSSETNLFAWLIGPIDSSVTECAVHPDTQYIADGAFMNCENLQRITFPSEGTITEIPDRAFFGCTSLTELTLPEGALSIGYQTFGECATLQSITLPSSLTSIGELAFSHCTSLEEICYLGALDDWEQIRKGETNRILTLTPIHCQDGDSVYPIRFYGRSLLFGEEAYLYDLFEAAIMADPPSATLTVDTEHFVLAEQCSNAYDIFLHDYPECFWADNALTFTSDSETGQVLEIQIHYTFEGETLINAKQELHAVVAEILLGMPEGTPFEQTLYLHDAVAERVVYRPNSMDQTSYGALVGGQAVCAGYAGAYQLLLQSAGYKAWSVSGYAGEPHRWTVVWLDPDTCVYTDVTWDDSEEHPISHGYFGLSLDEMSEDHFPSDPSALPECNHTTHSYDDHASVTVLSDSSPVSDLYSALTPQGEAFTAVFYFVGEDLDQWLNTGLIPIATHLGWRSISASYVTVRNEVLLTIFNG